MAQTEVPSAPSMESIVSQELSNKSKMYSHPKYKLTQLYPITSANQNAIITAAGGTEITFQLPVKVMNLGRSYLNLTLTPTAGGAALANILHASPLSFLRQIQLFTQAGVYLTDLYYANQYMNTVYFPETSHDEFATNEILTSTSVNTHSTLAQMSGFIGTTVNADYAKRISTTNAGVLAATGNDDVAISYSERKYFHAVTAANSATPVMKIKIPMSYIKNTILSMNRDMYFGEVLNLRFVTESYNSVGFVSTVAAGPTVPDVTVGAAALAGNITLGDVTFFCAIEQDLNIAQQIINEVNTAGINISIPYVYSFRTTNTASASQTISLRFNRSHGKKLRRIYHAPSHDNESGIYCYLRENKGGAKTVASLYTLLNNDRLQEFNIDCTKAEDYMTLKQKLKNSVYLNVDTYQQGWFWVDDFTSEEPLHSSASQDIKLSSGIDLTSEQKWDIYMTTQNRALTHYSFAITEKTLTIRPGSTTVM